MTRPPVPIGEAPLPDFGEVMERAHDLDPDAIEPEQVVQARRITEQTGPAVLATVVDRRDPALEPFIVSMRRTMARRLAAEHERGFSPPSLSGGRTSPRRIGLGLVGLAAALLLGWWGLRALRDHATLESGSTAAQAGYDAESRPGGMAQRGALRPSPGGTAIELRPAPVEPPGPPATPEPTRVEPEPEEPPAEPPRSRRASQTRPTRVRLRELDAQAQAHWRAGRLEQARATLEEITRLGRRTRWAELAFGDLFTLAHQAGDSGREARLWRRYLARFPRGRFADDVRAGQCRRAPAARRGPCWTDYLADFPRGAHLREARAQSTASGQRRP